MAKIYIEKKEFEKVPELLGNSLSIKDLYPEREIFHLSEITGFQKVLILYFAETDKLELADEQYEILQKIAPDHPDTEQAMRILFPFRAAKMQKMMDEENKNRILPKIARSLPPQTKEKPAFNHSQTLNLYKYDFSIPHHLLKEILELPRKTVIEDLEKILEDVVLRFDWFSSKEYNRDTHSFIFHAIFLLMELKAEESLDKILSFLEYDGDVLDYWLGEHKTETLWQCIFVLGKSRTNDLKDFLLKPGIYTYSKSIVSETLAQIAIHFPERRDEERSIFSDVLNCILLAGKEDNIIDTDFTGMMIGDIMDCAYVELLPVIKSLYDKNYFSAMINGDYSQIEKEIAEEKPLDHKRELQNIFDLYDHIVDTWYNSGQDEIETEEDDYYPLNHVEQAVSEKIGRNEPCPCGSGKKYKKCCWGK